MARKNQSATSNFVLFDVHYDDGTQSSNRKVPADDLDGLDGDEPARDFLEKEERRIQELSGKPRPRIKSIARSGKKKKAAS